MLPAIYAKWPELAELLKKLNDMLQRQRQAFAATTAVAGTTGSAASGSITFSTDGTITSTVTVDASGNATVDLDVASEAITAAELGPAAVTTVKVADENITYPKIQNVSAASRLLGRGSASGAGDVEELTAGDGLSIATTTIGIADAGVTYARIQDISAASRLLGRGSAAGAGDTQELTVGGGLSISGTVLSSQNFISQAISTKTTAYTILSTDGVILADATSAGFTLTLPTAASMSGRSVVVKKIDASANAVTIDGDGAETIDGAATVSTAVQWTAFRLVSNGTAWFLV